jgi:single-strand DNA-binding protein
LIEGKIEGKVEKQIINGIDGCIFSIASNSFVNKKMQTSYFKILATGKHSEAVLINGKEGRGVRIVGKLMQNWLTDEDKELQYEIVIIPEHIEFKNE